MADRPTSTVPEVGIRDRAPNIVALLNASVCTQAGQDVTGQTIVIQDGIITAVGPKITVPPQARQVDLDGKTIYPALIDAYSEISVAAPQTASGHWNPKTTPHRRALAGWKRNSGDDKSYREAGFALRLVAPRDGVLRGSSAVVTTGTSPTELSVVRDRVAQHIRLTTRGSRDQFPNSPMGAVALARQTLYDAIWYRDAWRAYELGNGAPRPERNDALAELSQALANDQLFIFHAPDEQYVLRANRFAVEFQLGRVAIVASGREYQRLDAIANAGRTLIVPVNFSKAPNVATVEAAQNATLEDLMHWHFAPENPSQLVQAGAEIVLTSHGLKKRTDFRKQVIQAVERGLSPDDALRLCTIAPAQLLGIDQVAGSIEVGKAAHLMVTDGDWLDQDSKIVETWVDGARFEHLPSPATDLSGTWKLAIQSKDEMKRTLFLQLTLDAGKLKGNAWRIEPTNEKKPVAAEQSTEAATDSESDKQHDEAPTNVKLVNIEADFGRLSAKFSAKLWKLDGHVHLTATAAGASDSVELFGQLRDEQGVAYAFRGTPHDRRSRESGDDAGDDQHDEDGPSGKQDGPNLEKLDLQVVYPLGAFGAKTDDLQAGTILLENATLWTCGDEGIVNGSLLIRDGQIVAVGSNIVVPQDAQRIDVRGKHITPGIIDCHSHMATDGGVNESTQAITAEVRIGDFIDATDIAIYRQLAGGVTTANVLHGSANPIGGQNQVIKLRWGKLPEAMKFAEAPQGIKFALGENVKQSNWGDDYRTRYPQSRLGVEQIMRDAFHAAKDYERQWAAWRTDGKGLPPRKDLELDALLQIVNRERWIHCHSYRQDEILALMRTLESFDIRIGTFQHILEGYKVAKEMAEHGAMGSAFSDWWAYKLEVYDAIPYNGALMHQAGIVVSFNSDDRELARHLNHEAAKAVKYGGVSREEALKFVTINPAKQLRIDEWVGSLEAGKQADLVVWSGDPLQITSRCEQTWIDGRRYFDIDQDQQRRREDAELHRQLVRRVLDSGEATRKPGETNGLFRNLFPRHDEYCGHAHGHDGHGH